MTTIAARAGVIAGEGRECDDDIVVSKEAVKVYKIPGRGVCGFSGNSEPCEVMLRSLRSGSKETPQLENMSGLLFDLNGGLWLYEGQIWRRMRRQFYAIGSGACFALAAMKAGADAVTACKIGAEMDPFSGGRVRSVSIKRVRR
jgi:ATP-dependent protease HslVU (ClpYQ) peptidase subunit